MKKLLLILLCFPFLVFSQNEKRLALVIGNANYDKGALNNPVNDALLIAETLKKLEFDVILDTNITNKRSFLETIREFGDRRPGYDVAFVYYAGHGIQVRSENYLLPTKEVFETEYHVQDYGVSVQAIMRYLTGITNQVNILILDACRDNPFEGNWNATRSLKGDGLAKIPPPTGSLIAFSTDAGNTAADGDGKNTVYCESLCKNLLLENISLDQVFRNVRSDVLERTSGNQRPVEASQLTGKTYYLNKTFSLYNSNLVEILNESNRLFLNKEQYLSIEVLNEAAELYNSKGDMYSESILRKKILERYHFDFTNKQNEIHLFPLTIEPREYEEIEQFFDVKSYDIYIENLIFFCETYVESSKSNISYNSIRSYLDYVTYYSNISIENYIGGQLISSKTALPFNRWESLQEYQNRYDELRNKLSLKINKDESPSLIYSFWNYKLEYMKLRNLGRTTIKTELKKVDIKNFSTEYYKDYYSYIKKVQSNVYKFSIDKDSLMTLNNNSTFFEDKVILETFEKYHDLEHELHRTIIDLCSRFDSKESIDFGTKAFLKSSEKYHSIPIARGFNVNDTELDLDITWYFMSLQHLMAGNIFYNGRDDESSVKLITLHQEYYDYMYSYHKYIAEIMNTKNKIEQKKKTLILADFLKQTNFRYGGMGEFFYSNLIDSKNKIRQNYLDILENWYNNYNPLSYISLSIDAVDKKFTNIERIQWKSSSDWYYTFQHAIAKLYLNDILKSTDSLNLKVSETLRYQIFPLTEYWNTLLPDHNNELLYVKRDLEITSGSAYFMWFEYIDQILKQLSQDDENKCLLLLYKIKLKTLVSTTSESYVWDLEDLVKDYENLFLSLENVESNLLKITVIKDLEKTLALFGDFEGTITGDSADRDLIEIYTNENYPGENISGLKTRLIDLL